MLEPATKTKTVEWLQHTLLPSILEIKDPSKYNASKIFRELTKIHRSHRCIERSFAEFSKREQELAGVARIHYFDGTTTWFEGSHCKLSRTGKEKTRGFYPQTLGFMMMTDNLGYPIAWKVVPGNIQDTSCFLEFAEKVKENHNLDSVTFCFDRGVASKKNFKSLATLGSFDNRNFHFISGIQDDQIKKIIDIDIFAREIRPILLKEAEALKLKLPSKDVSEGQIPNRRRLFNVRGYSKYSRRVFYNDLGDKGKYRYIASFNAEIFEAENAKIEHNIDETLRRVSDLNLELLIAKRGRDHPDARLREIFSEQKTTRFFSYKAIPISSHYKAQSFKIVLEINKVAIDASKATAGMMIFITSHSAKISGGLANRNFVSAVDIINHYRAKNVVENSFRELKSFLKIRPIHVWTEEHVHAHFDIATIAYFINNFIYLRLVPIGVSLREFYRLLKDHSLAVRLRSSQGKTSVKYEQPSEMLLNCLDALGIKDKVNSIIQAATRNDALYS